MFTHLAKHLLGVTPLGVELDRAIAAVWDGVPVQRCTVHKHRNLLAHAPERLHEEIAADYSDMIYAATRQEIEARRKAFIRKWRLKHQLATTTRGTFRSSRLDERQVVHRFIAQADLKLRAARALMHERYDRMHWLASRDGGRAARRQKKFQV